MTNKNYDIIIIGGGVVGCSIARELSKYDLKIALLEKEVELAFGVSKSNSGIIHPGTQVKSDSLKGRLCVEGNKLIRKIAKELGIDFQEVGELIVAFSEKDIAKLKAIKAEAQKLGVENMRIVGLHCLKLTEPNLSKDVVAALFIPSAGIISPYRMTYDLSENAAKNGVEIFTNNEVNDIVFKKKNSFEIKPRKGQEFLLDKKRENVVNHIIFPLPTKTSKGVLVIKTSDGNPMVGPTARDVDDKEDLSTTDDGLKEVLSSVKQMVPSINESDIIAYFSGLRPVAGDDFIIRHESSVPGFVNVAGIQSPGLTAAPAIAKMVCSVLQNNGLTLLRKKDFKRYRAQTAHLFKISKAKAKKLIKEHEGYGDIVCRCEMVSRKEIEEAIDRGATTLDGIKFRTRAQAGRCHGGFCTTRILKILSEKLNVPITSVTKRGKGSLIVKGKRA